MLKSLTRRKNELYYLVDGERVSGVPAGLWGDASGLWGDASGLRGNVTGLSGDATGLSGDATGLWGNVTGLRGNDTGLSGDATGLRGDVDACQITDTERAAGVDVDSLVQGDGESTVANCVQLTPED